MFALMSLLPYSLS